jgi:hypothetical protein
MADDGMDPMAYGVAIVQYAAGEVFDCGGCADAPLHGVEFSTLQVQ